MYLQVDVKGTGLEHLVNGSMGKALSVYALNPADKVLGSVAVRCSPRGHGRQSAFGAGNRVPDENEARS